MILEVAMSTTLKNEHIHPFSWDFSSDKDDFVYLTYNRFCFMCKVKTTTAIEYLVASVSVASLVCLSPV